MQDFTGVPAVVDLAAMRDGVVKLGGDPSRVNPLQPVELVIDHSVQVDHFGGLDSFALNVDLDPAPFTQWITACGLEDAQFTTMARELGRPVAVDEVRPAAADAIAEVFELELVEPAYAGGRRPSSTTAT